MATTAQSTATKRELIIRRVFDAPRGLVWQALIERDHVMQWLGPAGYTALEFEMDAEVGGAWRSGLRSPEGTEYVHRGVVREVEEPKQLVFTCAPENDGPASREMLISIALVERDGGTEMTLRQSVFESKEGRGGRKEGHIASHLGVAA